VKNKHQNQFVQIFLFGIILGFGLFFLYNNYADASGGLNNAFNLPKFPSSNKFDNVQEVVVNRVVDGDTIELNDGRKIRFLNIDTPETVKPNTPIMCYGKEAKAFVIESIEKKTVWLTFDKEKTDKYGRTLAFIFKDKNALNSGKITESLNYEMVTVGLARSVFYPPNTTYKPEFLSASQTAIDKKVGIYKACPKPFQQ
jgi:micrococcal nuclease